MAKLSYRELQRRLKIFETVVGDVDRSSKKSVLQKEYDRILEEHPGIDKLLNLNGTTPEPKEAEPEESKTEEKPCPVCGGSMSLDDNWWRCQSCKHKSFNY